MGRDRARPVEIDKQSRIAEARDNVAHNTARGSGIDRDDEVTELFERRPIFWAIAERCGELARQAQRLPNGSPERRSIDRRRQKLSAYTFPPIHDKPASELDSAARGFAQLLLKSSTTYTWEQVKKYTDGFIDSMRKRPVGHPVEYRYRITEALETKLAHRRTWNQIWEQMSQEVYIPFEDFNRQVQLLKRMLRREGIPLPPPAGK